MTDVDPNILPSVPLWEFDGAILHDKICTSRQLRINGDRINGSEKTSPDNFQQHREKRDSFHMFQSSVIHMRGLPAFKLHHII